jgi:UDPglucose 6-dehydrogenase
MKISVIGTGYVGLVTGVCLASKGHQVICIDKQSEIVNKINNKISPIYEPGLEDLLCEVIEKGNLVATTDLKNAVMNTDISIISVGTPFGDGKIDLRYIESAAQEIGNVLKEKKAYHVICVKSTVIPTTTDTLVKTILENASGKKAGDFGLAMNPEFLREGKAVEDFMFPDRIVIGSYDQESFETMKKVYQDFFDAPIMNVNLRTAEMIKYTANALLATLISYSNEVSVICEKVGSVDVKEVLEGVTLDKRFNPRVNNQLINPGMISYLRAGCGFGGSCFPKDVQALSAFSKEMGYSPSMIQATLEINEAQPYRLIERLHSNLGTLENKRIVVLGLSFKPETDDIRESPSLAIIKGLLAKKAKVIGVDPIAIDNIKKHFPQNDSLTYSVDYKNALKDAEAAILVTPWPDYINISPKEFKELMKEPILVDGRRVFDKSSYEAAGVQYIGVGLT